MRHGNVGLRFSKHVHVPLALSLLALYLASTSALSCSKSAGSTADEDPRILPDSPELMDVSPTVQCDNVYALCAEAECFVYNFLAYCECDILDGTSISAPFEYPVLDPPPAGRQNICDLNEQGVAESAFMASTYSLPEDTQRGGTMALYTCPANSRGAYAQCDGGICFTSTSGASFPGFAEPLAADEIICSCPITIASDARNQFGYQFVGPFPCTREEFEKCGPATNQLNGTIIPVGAPTGAARFLTIELNGENVPVNECFPFVTP